MDEKLEDTSQSDESVLAKMSEAARGTLLMTIRRLKHEGIIDKRRVNFVALQSDIPTEVIVAEEPIFKREGSGYQDSDSRSTWLGGDVSRDSGYWQPPKQPEIIGYQKIEYLLCAAFPTLNCETGIIEKERGLLIKIRPISSNESLEAPSNPEEARKRLLAEEVKTFKAELYPPVEFLLSDEDTRVWKMLIDGKLEEWRNDDILKIEAQKKEWETAQVLALECQRLFRERTAFILKAKECRASILDRRGQYGGYHNENVQKSYQHLGPVAKLEAIKSLLQEDCKKLGESVSVALEQKQRELDRRMALFGPANERLNKISDLINETNFRPDVDVDRIQAMFSEIDLLLSNKDASGITKLPDPETATKRMDSLEFAIRAGREK